MQKAIFDVASLHLRERNVPHEPEALPCKNE